MRKRAEMGQTSNKCKMLSNRISSLKISFTRNVQCSDQINTDEGKTIGLFCFCLKKQKFCIKSVCLLIDLK